MRHLRVERRSPMMLHPVRLAVPIETRPDMSLSERIILNDRLGQAWDDARADRRVEAPCWVLIIRRARLRLEDHENRAALATVAKFITTRLELLGVAPPPVAVHIRYGHEFSTDAVPNEVVVQIEHDPASKWELAVDRGRP